MTATQKIGKIVSLLASVWFMVVLVALTIVSSTGGVSFGSFVIGVLLFGSLPGGVAYKIGQILQAD